MNKYTVAIVQKNEAEDRIELCHIMVYGRSESEAIEYVLKHKVFFRGIVLAINAIDCSKNPDISKFDILTKEGKEIDDWTGI